MESDAIQIAPLREQDRATAARLFWEAFRDKLGRVMGPQDKGLAFVRRVLDPGHGLGAFRHSVLIGIAGFKTAQGSLVGGGWADLRAVYGAFGTLWRLPLLAMLERPVSDDVLLMDGIVVDRSARGLGAGSALLSAIKEEARGRGKSCVRLDVIDRNPRARALYERHGFVAQDTKSIGPLRHIFGFGAVTEMMFRPTLPDT